jgi:hypothetical protein
MIIELKGYKMNDEARVEVIKAFDSETGYFYNKTPYCYDQFIDGLAWVGTFVGACLKVGDTEGANRGITYCSNILLVGKDARTYAPTQVKPEWKASTTMPGFWYYEKPQEAAGPLGLKIALNHGATITVPPYMNDKITSALSLTRYGWAFGVVARYVKAIRGHANAMFMAYLASGKKPPSTMLWLCEENPFFSAIAGKKCDVTYPPRRRFVQGKTKTVNRVVALQNTEPCIWPFRRDPFSCYYDAGSGELTDDAYVPVYKVVGDYLQSGA